MKRRRIFDNWGIKLISILLALLLWILVTLDRDYTRRVSARLTLTDLPERLVLANLLSASVEAMVQARGSDLIRLNLTRPEVEIPCSDFQRGDNEVELLPEYFLTPRQIKVQVLELRPHALTVTLDQVTTQIKPVKARLAGDPRPGYIRVGPVRLEPDRIEVTGPNAIVSQLDTVRTERIPLATVDKPIILRVRIALDEAFPGLTGHPDSVTASADIDPVLKRQFTDVPVALGRLRRSASIRVDPPRLTVILSGAESIIAEVSPEDVKAVIDVFNFRSGTYNLPARIIFPFGLSLVAAEPQTFRVTVE